MGIYSSMFQWMSINGQDLAVASASATVSAAFPTGTTSIRVVSTVGVYIEMALGASASSGTGGYLPANVIEHLPAQASKTLSAITTGAAGILNIKPCSD